MSTISTSQSTIGQMMLMRRGGAVSYLLRDLFTTDRAAGSVNGTAAEPGPGTRSATDTGSNFVITGNKAVASGIAGAADPSFGYSDAIERVAGRTIKYNIKYISSRGHSGLCISATPTAPIYGIYEPGGILIVIQPAQNGYVSFVNGTTYTIWITLFTSGAAMWAQGGVYTNPELIFVTSRYNTSPLYCFPIIARAVACAMEASQVEIVDRPTLATRELLATVYQASPSNGVNYTTTADALHSLNFTLPGSPSAGDRIGLHYRQSDASNYWDAYIERNVGNTAWDFKLDLVTAGTPVNQISATGVGTPDEIFIITDGNDHWCFTGASSVHTIRGTKQTSASFATATEVGAWFDAGTVSLLESFAREWNL